MSSQPKLVACAALVVVFFTGEAIAGKDGYIRRDVASDDIEDMMITSPEATQDQPAASEPQGYSDDYLREEEETESEAPSQSRTTRTKR